MNRTTILLVTVIVCLTSACSDNDRFDVGVQIPTFNFPQTVVFEENLSAYGLFAGTPSELVPQTDFYELELSSVLFTDYAHKQRLIKVPAGKQATRRDDNAIDFPDGTILVKTFFYNDDERDPGLGKRIIESRLLIRESNTWNLATYVWNEAQTDATLTLNGLDTQVAWMDGEGNSRSTLYHVPAQNECMTCHQSNTAITTLGPSLRNLNRMVDRDGNPVNQIDHLQFVGVLDDFPTSSLPQIVDYTDPTVPLLDRGRAYLAMNCAHCHHPSGWDKPAERDFDFRYETPLSQTGLTFEKDKVISVVTEGEMPFIGTTLLDEAGIELVVAFMEGL